MTRRGGAIVAIVLLLCGCSTSDDGPSEEEAGALAFAQEYVDAIAALDLDTIEAMTGPEAFHYLDESEAVDLRAALPEAVDPITDPWVSLVSQYDGSEIEPVEFLINASYDLNGLTGGEDFVVTLTEGANPDELTSWTVTDPLILQKPTYSHLKHAKIGSVDLDYALNTHVSVWGYPAGYLLEPRTPRPDVEPVWLGVGAADAPYWDESLRVLEPRDQD